MFAYAGGSQQGQAMGLAAAKEDRVEPRVRAMVRARLRDDAGERDVCIIDVSTRGVLATAARPPKRGEIVEIAVGNNFLAGQVKWASERRFGLSLQERVSVAAMVEGGKQAVALARSSSVAKRRTGLWQALTSNPEMMGRAVQLGMLLAVALGAAWLIADLVGSGLAPMEQAASAMTGRKP